MKKEVMNQYEQEKEAPIANLAGGRKFLRHWSVQKLSLFLVGGLILYFGWSFTDSWRIFFAEVAAFPAQLWGEVLALSLLSYTLRFIRWHGFIRALGVHVPLMRHFEIYLAAFALTLTPGKSGETIRSVYLRPYGVRFGKSLGAFVAERLLDVVAVGLLASLSVMLFPDYRLWLLIVMACFLGGILLFRSRFLPFLIERVMKGKFKEHGIDMAATLTFLLSGKRVILGFGFSLLAWFAQGLSLYLIISNLGYSLPLFLVVAVFSFSLLAGAASFIPGGLGATEAAITLLLSLAGVSYQDALTASLMARAMTLGLAIVIGLLAMSKIALMRGDHS